MSKRTIVPWTGSPEVEANVVSSSEGKEFLSFVVDEVQYAGLSIKDSPAYPDLWLFKSTGDSDIVLVFDELLLEAAIIAEGRRREVVVTDGYTTAPCQAYTWDLENSEACIFMLNGERHVGVYAMFSFSIEKLARHHHDFWSHEIYGPGELREKLNSLAELCDQARQAYEAKESTRA